MSKRLTPEIEDSLVQSFLDSEQGPGSDINQELKDLNSVGSIAMWAFSNDRLYRGVGRVGYPIFVDEAIMIQNLGLPQLADLDDF